ncbi:UNVERIFIED_CONTAM: hypothetical protein FKN15_000379 [Acipenser sinensis]
MESCESPAVSGTDDGLASTISQQQQHLPPQPWNEHTRSPTPPSSQPLPLEPLSLSAPYPSSQLQAPSTPLQEGVREQQKHRTHTAPGESAKAERQTRTEEEEEEGSCGEEDDDDLDDLDDDEGMDCYPSLQPFPGMPVAPGVGMPALLGQRTRRPVAAESGSEEGEEEEEEECSDVENLAGEIVYQADGSAYIVESISQLIQSGGGVAPSGLLPTNSLLPNLGKQGEPAGTSSAVYPQIINTFHIASSFGKWFGSSDQGFPNTSSLAGLSPVLHSFRVFDVRHKSNKDYLNSDGSAKNSCVSKDVPNNVDFSKFDGLALYGQGKPILIKAELIKEKKKKHMHNMMLLQQNMSQMQHGRLGLGALPSPSEAELYQYYLTQNMNLPPGLKMDSSGADTQYLLGGFQLDPNMAALAPALVGSEIPMDMRLGGGQLVSEELMSLGESLSQSSDPSLKLFQCAVCNRFTTDNLEMLGLHMGTERSLPEEEWHAVVGDSHQCKLCRYTTQLKANFQLHCKTDKHVQKYQLVAHIKEGGKGNEWRLKCVAIGNPVHLKCNACDYYTNSLEKLRLHTVNSRHEASLKLYKVSECRHTPPFLSFNVV